MISPPIPGFCGFSGKFRFSLGNVSPRTRPGFYHCNACNFDFTVRTGTIFERSKVPLHKWVYAMYLLVTARKGISSLQLAKEIGVTQKTAWFILGRLREACSSPDSIDNLRGIVQGIAQIGALAGKLASGAVIAISVPGLSDPVEIRLK